MLAFGQARKAKTPAKSPAKTTAAKADTAAKPLTRAEAHKAYVEKYDKNKDGKLDAEERKAAREDTLKNRKSRTSLQQERFKQQLLRAFDKNRDGQLDAKEQQAARKAIAKQQQQYMKKMQQMMRRGGGRGGRGGGGGGGRGGSSSGTAAFRKLMQFQKRYLQQLQKQQQSRPKP